MSGTSFTLREANVLDQAGSFVGPLDVQIEAGRVKAVGGNLPRGEGVSIDFSGLWLMPGVFDCHDHLSFSTVEMTEVPQHARQPVGPRGGAQRPDHARVGGHVRTRPRGRRSRHSRSARCGLRVRTRAPDLGRADLSDGWARRRIPARRRVSSRCSTPDFPGRPPFVVDGVDSMRHTVRAILRAGADWIKLATTGGLVSDHDQPLDRPS